MLYEVITLECLAERGLQHVQLSFQGAEPENADRIGVMRLWAFERNNFV